MASKPSQTNMDRPAACLLLPKSSQFGELERVDIFMTNPFGEFGVLEKNVHRVCHGHCILPSSSLCFGSFQTILNGKPGVKLACIYMQIGSGSSVGLMTRIWHALKGRSWPGILFMILQTGL